MSWFRNFERRVENFFGFEGKTAKLRREHEQGRPHPEPAHGAPPTVRLASDVSRVSGTNRLQTMALAEPAGGQASIAGLEGQIQKILGPGVKFAGSGNSQWSVQDLQGVLKAVQSLPPSVTPSLANATFARVPIAPDGSSDYAQTDFQGNEQVGGSLTISFTDAASKTGQLDEVAAHEFGHVADAGGRFDPSAIREFGKLSHFIKNSDGTMEDGYNNAGMEVAGDAGGDTPLNTTNFVHDAGSKMAQTSATEDYAESFRNYLLHPDQLMAAAPDKFLYLNSQFGKYSAAQVQGIAASNKVDLPVVMAELRGSDLRPETLAKIGQTQGLGQAGTSGTAAGDMIAAVTANLGNASFLNQFRSGSAQQALGPALWNRLSKSEQSLLSQPAYASKLVATVQANHAAPADDVTNGDLTALTNLANLMLQVPSDGEKIAMFFNPSERTNYLEGLIHNPQVWNNLDPALKNLVNSPQGQDVVNTLASNPDFVGLAGKLWGGVHFLFFNIGPTQDPQTISNLRSNLSRIGPSQIELAKTLLKNDNHDDLNTLAKGIANLGNAMDMQAGKNQMV